MSKLSSVALTSSIAAAMDMGSVEMYGVTL